MSSDLTALFGNAEGFDPMSVEPQADFNVVPPGKYPVVIESSVMKRNSKGTGSFLAIVCVILDGPEGVKGRKIFDNLNLDNPNAQCVEIALRSFSALSRSLGLQRVPDSRLLIGGRCIACVKVKDGSNEIRTYEPLPVAVGPPAAAAAQQVAPAHGLVPIANQPATIHAQPPLPALLGQNLLPPTTVPLPVQPSVAPAAPVAAPVSDAASPVAPVVPAAAPGAVPVAAVRPCVATAYLPGVDATQQPTPAASTKLPTPWQAPPPEEDIPF